VRDEWLEQKFAMTRKLGWAAFIGLIALAVGFLFSDRLVLLRTILFVTAAIMIVPLFFYICILTIWHWKRRYRGKHSDLWGAILLIETSGWFKIIYWFRHILPDWRGRGRYSR
jgi:hypothetical protein